jgi:glycopeptide antibiotics resistance protein
MGALLRAFWFIVPVTAIALPYALISWPLLVQARRRRNPTAPIRLVTATSAVDVAICLIGVLVLCLVTMPVGDSHDSTLDLVPFADIAGSFRDDGSLWQVFGNLLLLFPLGALLPIRIRRLRAVCRIALTALVFSVLVEGTQYLLHDGRVTSTDDVLLNTTGATLGAAAFRRGWRKLDIPVKPVHIPSPRRVVCAAQTITLRVPRSVWDTRYAAVAHPEQR